MLYYIFFFLFILISLYFKEVKTNFKIDRIQLSFTIIILFSAFRFDVGYDFSMYYHLIDGSTPFLDAQINRLEFLSRNLVILSNKIGFYQLFFILTSFLIYIPIGYTIKKNSLDTKLSTLIFICVPLFYFNSLSIIRQFVAVALIFYSFNFIKKKQFFNFLISVFIAFFFHKSAIIGLPIYFIYQNSHLIKRKMILIIYIAGFFSSKIIGFLTSYFFSQYAGYVEGRIAGEGGNLLLKLFQVIGLLLLIILYQKKETKKDFNFYIISFFIGLFIWSSLSHFGHAGYRGSLYFTIFVLLLIPCLTQRIKQKKLFKEITVVICTLMFFLNLYIGSRHKIKDPNMPYQIFLFKTSKDFKPNE